MSEFYNIRNAALKPVWDALENGDIIGKSTLTTDDISLPNSDFDPSGKSEFISFDMLGNISTPLGQGATSADMNNVSCQVSVFVSASQPGMDLYALGILDDVANLYKTYSVKDYGIISLEVIGSDKGSPRTDGAWYAIDLTINFETYIKR